MVEKLSSEHQQMLRQESSINDEVIEARGYRTLITKAEAKQRGFSSLQARVPALLLPLWTVDGECPTAQIRPNEPRIKNGKKIKYETPFKSQVRLDINPIARPWLRDLSRPLFITEGIKKGDAAVSRGLCCIALLGVYNWRGTDDGNAVAELPDWEAVALKSGDGTPHRVYICFDSDVMQKREVALALKRLMRFLQRRGADVKVIYLPSKPGGEKQGLDDFFAGGHSVDELLGYAQAELRYIPGDDDGKKSQSSKLLEIAANITCFHTPDQKGFACVPINSHFENLSIQSGAFRDWIIREFRLAEEISPGSQAVQDAVNQLSAKARFDGEQHEVHVRVAAQGEVIYLDLCDSDWRVVCITKDGWEVVPAQSIPVKFRRARGMLALPEPRKGGTLADLRKFINVHDEDWVLVLSWLVAALRPDRPFPVLVLHGEQGSAKSTTARLLRSLIDPNRAQLRSAPSDKRDLMIAATNSWLVCLNNLSHVNPWLSDALCCLSTGGGFATRELHSDNEEALFEAMRPIMLNGIEELVTRGDLLERSLVLHLPSITDSSRRDEEEIEREFESARPFILGALLEAVSTALRNMGSISLAKRPRMADFAKWSVAAEPAFLCGAGEFLRRHTENRVTADELAVESSPIASALLAFIKQKQHWTGTAAQLLPQLSAFAGDQRQSSSWPKTPQRLGGQLVRLAPSLRAFGIEIRSGRYGDREGGTGRRLISVDLIEEHLSQLSRLSSASDFDPNSDEDSDNPFIVRSNSSHKLPYHMEYCDDSDKGDDEDDY
jgi:hypothetical protein